MRRPTPLTVLLDRVRCTGDNWERFTVRSVVELGTWVCVGAIAAERGGLLLGLLCGTVASWVVVLCGECVAKLEPQCIAATRLHRVDSGSTFLLCMMGPSALKLIYESLCCNVALQLLAGLLAGLASFALLTTANLCAAWPPSRRVGQTLQARVLSAEQTARNWRDRPVRSLVEACTWTGVTLGAYASWRSVLLAVQLGTLAGIACVLFSEAVSACAATPLGRAGRAARQLHEALVRHQQGAAQLQLYALLLLLLSSEFAPSGGGPGERAPLPAGDDDAPAVLSNVSDHPMSMSMPHALFRL